MEESGHDADFYYYIMDIGDICLISNSDDEAARLIIFASVIDASAITVVAIAAST